MWNLQCQTMQLKTGGKLQFELNRDAGLYHKADIWAEQDTTRATCAPANAALKLPGSFLLCLLDLDRTDQQINWQFGSNM
jgi:hypothetical protein